MNKDKLKGIVWGSLLGDTYSNNKVLSLYGKQTIWLLEYLTKSTVYDPFSYGEIWKQKMSQEENIDKASLDTLANLRSGRTYLGAGSGSNDLSVIGRHGPIIFTVKGMDEILESIKFHTCLTHMNKETIDASKYITEVTLAMIYNLNMTNTLKERSKFYGEEVEEQVNQAFKLQDAPLEEALRTFGNGTGVKNALALTIYFLLNYHEDFEQLLKVNLQAGGESKARAMVAGMIVGAKYGFEAIKPICIKEIKEYSMIHELLEKHS